ncbi:MAG TPA: hypothetical protein PLL01_03940 [Rhodoferax sp.]|nr:hypothetical protein [Rhodoferax sp.]
MKGKIWAKADSKVARAAVSKTDSNTSSATESPVVEADALVSRASVSTEVSSKKADTKVSAALVSALVSALRAVETCEGFGGFPISKDWLAKQQNE